MQERARTTYALAVLFAANTLNFFDRQILGAVGEPIRREWALGDGALGALGTAFTLLYAFVGIPLGRLSDRMRRPRILAGGVFGWSLLTAFSGMATSFWQLFMLRLGVGVGEASCAPAATSLIGDLVPAARRARALSIFMLGLPVGIALSYAVSAAVAQEWGWRAAFLVAGPPGLVCAAAVLAIDEPRRGRAEAHHVGARRRAGCAYRLVLEIPTMWWLIASGALHNFNMYAIATFLSPFLMRFHGVGLRDAGVIAMAVYGVTGAAGLLLGGFASDAGLRVRPNGRLLVGAAATLVSVPLLLMALSRPAGDAAGFATLMGAACALMYMYYSTVYATIHDILEPALRGTAMAVYFFAMYVLGASLGPFGTGLASDHFTARAAWAAGMGHLTGAALEPFRAQGLHAALYIVPALDLLLALVLWAGALTVGSDRDKLERWMRGAARPAAEN